MISHIELRLYENILIYLIILINTEMESADFSHAGMEYVVAMMMVHSVSPKARRLTEKLLVDNPYQVNIQPDRDSTNRSAEILNAYLKAIGLRLKFIKRKKNIKPAIYMNAIEMVYNDMPSAITLFDQNQYIDMDSFYKFKEKQAKSAITLDAIELYYNQEADKYEKSEDI